MITRSAIVLAAGQGTRMNHPELPKVLVPAVGKPLITWVLGTLERVGITDPVIVIKYKAELVRSTLGTHRYVDQGEQVGTGAAAQAARSELGSTDGLIYIANGDCPCFSPATYEALATAMVDEQTVLALTTGTVSAVAERYGRIVRSSDGTVERIVEYKDATESEKSIREYNAGLYLVRSPWLWSALERIAPSPVTGEYYLTDIVALARADGFRVAGVPVADPAEAHGVNTPEELELAEGILRRN